MTAVRSRHARRSLEVAQSKVATRSHGTAAPSRSTKSRAVVRPLPQKAAGLQLRVFPRRVISLRLLALLVGLLSFAFLFCAVAIQSQRISGQQEIDRLSNDISIEQDVYRSLRAQVAEREAPERITAEAEKLNMMEPGPVVPLTPKSPASRGAESTTEQAVDQVEKASQ